MTRKPVVCLFLLFFAFTAHAQTPPKPAEMAAEPAKAAETATAVNPRLIQFALRLAF